MIKRMRLQPETILGFSLKEIRSIDLGFGLGFDNNFIAYWVKYSDYLYNQVSNIMKKMCLDLLPTYYIYTVYIL